MITLPEAVVPLPSVLVGVWKLGQRWGSYGPIVHGYDLHAGRIGGDGGAYDWTRTTSWKWHTQQKTQPSYRTTVHVDDVVLATKTPPEPWFITFNSHLVHGPTHVPPAHLHTQGDPTTDFERYLAMIEAADSEIGRLIQSLDLRTTTVFLLSDNGSKGSYTHPPATGKATTFEGGVNCPLIVAGRGVRPGAISSSLVSGVDLYETTLELMGRNGASTPCGSSSTRRCGRQGRAPEKAKRDRRGGRRAPSSDRSETPGRSPRPRSWNAGFSCRC